MDRIQKFLSKLSKKDRHVLVKVLADIRALNLQGYDVKPLKGYKGLFRLRKGKIRIVFAKSDKIGVVTNVGYRKDIYQSM